MSSRGYGIAKEMYRYFIQHEGYTIIGDSIQYFGARVLWSRISMMSDIVVDIFNSKTGKYIENDVTLRHGSEDWDFDNRVWSYDTDKEHIRLIMKRV